jgi:FlaA1/EpsC-like NDP-sugar epimerase
MKVTDLASAVAPDAKQEIIGIRPGEKLHEQMIGEEDAPSTFEYQDHYKILPVLHNWDHDPSRIKDGKKVQPGFEYNSNNNSEWMTKEQLKSWLEKNEKSLGKI